MIASNLLLAFGIVVGACVVGVVATLVLRRRRRHVWARFAGERGFLFVPTDPPRVEGTIEGRPFRLEMLRSGSDSGELGAEDVRMSLGLRHPAPADVRLRSAEGMLGDLVRGADPEAEKTGDADLDTHARVEGRSESLAGWLTPARKRALLRLLEFEGSASGLEGAEIWIQNRELLSDLPTLDRFRSRLVEVADALDREGARG